MRAHSPLAGLIRLDFRPAGTQRLDLEIFSVSDLRQRVSKQFFAATHRYQFHMLLCVDHGKCTHLVDFEPFACKPGSLLTIQPAQAHRFGPEQQWDGWIVLFRPEFLLSPNEALPCHVRLPKPELRIVKGAMAQMQQDSLSAAPTDQVRALLQYQMSALLMRLAMLHNRQRSSGHIYRFTRRRFENFQRLVESRFSHWHGVAEYAARLGCSEKSLGRAVMEGAGVSAKSFIASRINLEAKRLLTHTILPVGVIGEQLGFEDAANFGKFFRREVGCAPGTFRRRQRMGSV